MKKILIIPFALLFSCTGLKDPKTGQKLDSQLLKDVKELSSDAYQGRKTGTKGAAMARTFIINRFDALGLKSYPQNVHYAQDFTFKTENANTNGTNIIGYIPGKTSNAIVISAHYDHLGTVDGKIYNGADDNASGTAALLKIAAHFAKNKPNNTLIFAAFDAEEMGLQGAKAFVANPPVEINYIFLNINMDMISRSDKNELYVCGTMKYPELKKYVDTTQQKIKLLFGHDDPKLGREDWTNQSDQGAFNTKDIPFLYFGVEDHVDYHQPSDKFEKINQTFYHNAANQILNVVKKVDQQTGLQLLLKNKMIMKEKRKF